MRMFHESLLKFHFSERQHCFCLTWVSCEEFNVGNQDVIWLDLEYEINHV